MYGGGPEVTANLRTPAREAWRRASDACDRVLHFDAEKLNVNKGRLLWVIRRRHPDDLLQELNGKTLVALCRRDASAVV